MPLFLTELVEQKPISLELLREDVPKKQLWPRLGLTRALFAGFYLRIHDERLSPRDWLASY